MNNIPKFTGKYDTHQNPIYEGDVISFYNEGLPAFRTICWDENVVVGSIVVGYFIPNDCEKISGYLFERKN